MTDKTLQDRLREHRVILKSGEYDGAQLMAAWCDMVNAADALDAQAERIKALEGGDEIVRELGALGDSLFPSAGTKVCKKAAARITLDAQEIAALKGELAAAQEARDQALAIARELARLACCMDALPMGSVGTQIAMLEALERRIGARA